MATKAPTIPVSLNANYDTTQIYSTGVEFALAGREGKKWKQATTFVYCKDFLHDAVWATLHKKPVVIYGFSYQPTDAVIKEPKKDSSEWYDWNELQQSGKMGKKDPPIHMQRIALLFRDTTSKTVADKEKFHEHRIGCLDFLHQIEEVMGFKPTVIHQARSKGKRPPTWLVLGDKQWMLAPTLVSLYALMIRVGYYHNSGGSFRRTLEMVRDGELGVKAEQDDYDDEGKAGGKDASFVSQAWKGIEVILKHGIKVFHEDMIDNYPADVTTHVLHDSYGIVNFTNKRPEKRMPRWYRKFLWK